MIIRLKLVFTVSLFAFVLSIPMLHQAQHPDSLYQKIKILKFSGNQNLGNDTVLFMAYNDLSRILTYNQPDSSLACCEFVINHITSSYADKLLTESVLKKILAVSYNQKGVLNTNKGNYTEAMIFYRMALQIRTTIGDRKGSGNTLNNMGLVSKNEGNYPKAISYHLEALKIRESIPDSEGLGASYNNIGSVYFAQNNYKEALENYRKALQIRQNIQDKKGIAVTSNNIGNMYMKEGNYKTALENYLLVLNAAIAINDKKLAAECYNNIGTCYDRQNKFNLAISNFQMALAIHEEIGDNYGMITTYKNLGLTFMDNHKYDDVVFYLNKAMNLAVKLNAKDQEMILYRDYAMLYAQMKRYKEAFESQKRYSEIKDTILSTEKNQQIAELQTLYETEKKDKEIDLLNKDKALKTEQLKSERTFRNAILFGSIMALLIVIILLNRYRVVNEQRKKTEHAEFEKELHELQMKALRSQMNPHFIFNCLNSVQRYILKNDKNNAVEYLQKFATLMRLILDNSEKNMVTLHDEIKMLDLYMHLEALRFDQGMDIELSIDPELQQEEIMIPSMILQPYVENAILHGLMHKEDKGKIKIEVRKQENMLKCVIEDNGIGREMAAEIKSRKTIRHQSKGLNITKARVELLNYMNNSSNTIVITDLKDRQNNPLGTRVEVVIPVMS